MATIKEDYVSFETAKLLKEKGFDESCYQKYDDEGYLSFNHVGYINSESPSDDFSALAPTHQMAMKWLREVCNLSVEVYRTACGYVGCIVSIPSGTDIKFLEEDGDDLPSGTYTKWEYACEATIKYCLEKLI